MPDPYKLFRQDLVSALRLSANAAKAAAPALRSASGAPPDSAEFTPVDTSGVGEFPWQWNDFGTFNADTWSFLNNIATLSDQGFVTLTAGLTTWYYNIISATAYLWTDQDRAELESLLATTRGLQEHIITSYQSMFTAIGPPERQVAAMALGLEVVNNLTYVVDYRIGYQWSGREAAGLPPFSASELRQADLTGLFAKAPANARETFLVPVSDMLNSERQWATRIDDLWNLSRSVRDAANNTHSPDISNKSGMYTVERDGTNAVRHSFSVAPSVSEIRNQLTSDTTLTVGFSAKRANQDKVSVAMPGGRPSQVPASVLALTSGADTTNALFAYDGVGDEAQVNILYHGPAEITVQAVPFAPDASTGWYFEHPMVQAAENHANAIETGYQFQLPTGDGPGAAANFGLLQTLLVCRAVTFQVLCPKGDLQRMEKSVPTGSSVGATLLGAIQLKGTAGLPLVASVGRDQQTGAPSILLSTGPDGRSGQPGPLAHVIGARIWNPIPETPKPTRVRALMARLSPLARASRTPTPDTGATLVSIYEATFSQITQKQMDAAGAQTKLSFILGHVLGEDWSGHAKAGLPPLTLPQMQSAANLRRLFPDMPLAGAEVLTESHKYLASATVHRP